MLRTPSPSREAAQDQLRQHQKLLVQQLQFYQQQQAQQNAGHALSLSSEVAAAEPLVPATKRPAAHTLSPCGLSGSGHVAAPLPPLAAFKRAHLNDPHAMADNVDKQGRACSSTGDDACPSQGLRASQVVVSAALASRVSANQISPSGENLTTCKRADLTSVNGGAGLRPGPDTSGRTSASTVQGADPAIAAQFWLHLLAGGAQGLLGQGTIGQGVIGHGACGPSTTSQGVIAQGIIGQGVVGQGAIAQGVIVQDVGQGVNDSGTVRRCTGEAEVPVQRSAIAPKDVRGESDQASQNCCNIGAPSGMSGSSGSGGGTPSLSAYGYHGQGLLGQGVLQGGHYGLSGGFGGWVGGTIRGSGVLGGTTSSPLCVLESGGSANGLSASDVGPAPACRNVTTEPLVDHDGRFRRSSARTRARCCTTADDAGTLSTALADTVATLEVPVRSCVRVGATCVSGFNEKALQCEGAPRGRPLIAPPLSTATADGGARPRRAMKRALAVDQSRAWPESESQTERQVAFDPNASLVTAATDEDDVGEGGGSKKQRFVWSPEVHACFCRAVHRLGVDQAKPQAIVRLMLTEATISGPIMPTRQNIKSHLQKYRLLLAKRREQGRGYDGRNTQGFHEMPSHVNRAAVAHASSQTAQGARPPSCSSRLPAVVDTHGTVDVFSGALGDDNDSFSGALGLPQSFDLAELAVPNGGIDLAHVCGSIQAGGLAGSGGVHGTFSGMPMRHLTGLSAPNLSGRNFSGAHSGAVSALSGGRTSSVECGRKLASSPIHMPHASFQIAAGAVSGRARMCVRRCGADKAGACMMPVASSCQLPSPGGELAVAGLTTAGLTQGVLMVGTNDSDYGDEGGFRYQQ